MFNAPVPPEDQLPTRRELLRSTGIAVVVGTVLLVTIVLPAEYGVDPTGVGDLVGLKRMGEIKRQLAEEAKAAESATEEAETEPPTPEAAASGSAPAPPDSATGQQPGQAPAPTTANRSDITEIVLGPDDGKELKLVMRKGATARYEWSTASGVVNFDKHGEPEDSPAEYISYAKGTAQSSDSGTITAAFDGLHGWFWRNRSQQAITIYLKVQGDYIELRVP